jgi:hypothetical protein
MFARTTNDSAIFSTAMQQAPHVDFQTPTETGYPTAPPSH